MPNLARFLEAQSTIYPRALAELRAGHKRTHWMWFIFPQIHGLGSSPTARLYAISGLAEAQDYLVHPTLGPRLQECTAAVNTHAGTSVSRIFGYPDDLKFHSSVTLFALAATPSPHQAHGHPERAQRVEGPAVLSTTATPYPPSQPHIPPQHAGTADPICVFAQALAIFFGGQQDSATLDRLAQTK